MPGLLRGWHAPLLLLIFLPSAALVRAQGNYEVQVYGAEMVPPARTMFELHSNFTFESMFAVDGVRGDVECPARTRVHSLRSAPQRFGDEGASDASGWRP